MATVHFYLVRHGQTKLNRAGDYRLSFNGKGNSDGETFRI